MLVKMVIVVTHRGVLTVYVQKELLLMDILVHVMDILAYLTREMAV